MNVPKTMVAFHLFFLILGLVTLLLMFSYIIVFDQVVLLAIVATVFLNALFGILWASEVLRTRPEGREAPPATPRAFPSISFVVPVHNVEQIIEPCISSLFEYAIRRSAPSEIIVVDDGSIDSTFEVAYSTINSRRQLQTRAHIRAKVVRHTAKLGKAEAIRTGVSMVLGEYIAIVDIRTACNSDRLSDLLRYVRTPETTAAPTTSGLYHAELLRRLLETR